MIIVIKDNIESEQYEKIKNFVRSQGAKVHESEGIEKKIIGIIGDDRKFDRTAMEAFPGVEKVIPVLEPFKLASRKAHPENTLVEIKSVKIGGLKPVIMAGPCSVETEAQIWEIAEYASSKGVNILRGGVFKPRTSPYAFQGHGEEAAKWIRAAGEHFNLPVISEVMEIEDISVLENYVDIYQVGARNMQNFKLLKALGKTDKPVMLKRGLSATLNEFLMSAEYILSEGNEKVILCERGIRTFVEYSRNTFDVNIVPAVKNVSHLPIIVDPSHATGKKELIPAVTLAGMAAGADGFVIEIHPRPYEAYSDGSQTLDFEQFDSLLEDWNLMKESVLQIRKRKNKFYIEECIK